MSDHDGRNRRRARIARNIAALKTGLRGTRASMLARGLPQDSQAGDKAGPAAEPTASVSPGAATPEPDQAPGSASGPAAGDPESVYDVYLTTDVRPAIRAASAEQMRGILRRVCERLCHYLRQDISGLPDLGPRRPRPWQVCEVGSGVRAGLQLYRRVTQAVAGDLLQMMSFDPDRAAADDAYLPAGIAPWLAQAPEKHMRLILLSLAADLRAIIDDSDTAATTSAQTEVPDDLWDVAAGARAGIGLYRHAVRVVIVEVLYHVWEGLGIGSVPSLAPFAPGSSGPDCFAIHPN